MNERILVVGGTGMLGVPVARAMRAEGYIVRIFSRSRERAARIFGMDFELAPGDVDDPLTLDEAAAGCQMVHINLEGRLDPDLERRGVVNTLQAAMRRGVRRITYLSGASVYAENCWFAGTRARFEAEAALRASGLETTIFKASWFLESLRRFVHGRYAFVIGRQSPAHWIAAREYAGMVVRSYALPEAANRDFTIFGSQVFTLGQAIERYCAIAHPGVHIVHLPIPLARLFAALGRREALKAALPFFAYHEKVHEQGNPAEAWRLLGKPVVTLEEWSREEQAPG